MSRLLLIILVVVVSNTTRAQQCIEISKEFEAGEIAFLFGDNVKLRSKPSTDSETLELLRIGDKVAIIEKTRETMDFQGMDSPWYKVNHEEKTGYIIGGLISRITTQNDAIKCFVSLERDDSQLYILTRVLSSSLPTYVENKSAYLGDDNEFCVTISDGKGVEGINAILQISYSPSSCAANSGGYHLFFDDKNLYKIMDLTSRGEYGYATSETLHFPNDDLGEENKIIYIKEESSQSDSYDEAENGYIYEKSSKYVVKLEWADHKLKPEPSVFQENP